MPIPQQDEKQKEFISRCVPIVLNDGTAESPEQAAAICYSLWRESRNKSPFEDGEQTMAHSDPQKCYVRKIDGEWRMTVLGAPYGGQNNGKDADGEYFSPNTNFMLQVGDERPVLYYHGSDPEGRPERQVEVIGKAVVTERNAQGLWFDVILDKTKKYASRIWQAAINGLARASSGAINYLVRRSETGELLQWPIGELTLIDRGDMRRPANELATVQLKAAFLDAGLDFPEMLLESDELKNSMAEPEGVGKRIISKKENIQWQTKPKAILKKN